MDYSNEGCIVSAWWSVLAGVLAGSVEMAVYRLGWFGCIQNGRSKGDKRLGKFEVERPFCSVLERFRDGDEKKKRQRVYLRTMC